MIWKHDHDCVRRVINIPWFFSSMCLHGLCDLIKDSLQTVLIGI